MAATILPLATGAGSSIAPAQLARMQKAARDFEANALGQLLEPMFNTVDMSKSKFGGGPGEATWRPMMVQEMAKSIAKGGGIGIAQPVLTQMIRMQEMQRTAE